MFNKFFTSLFLFALSIGIAVGQSESNSDLQSHIIGFTIGYGYEKKGGDFTKRYGDNLMFSLGTGYVSARNFTLDLEMGFRFGDNIKEDVLAKYRNLNDVIIGNDGNPASIFLRERGLGMHVIFGKIWSKNTQSGLKTSIGLGYNAHRLRFLDDSKSVGVIAGDYAKGYDRLTGGFSIKEQIGYEIHSANGLINGHIALEFTQALTSSKRAYQFDLGKVDSSKKLDLIFALKATYMLPLFRSDSSEKTIYY